MYRAIYDSIRESATGMGACEKGKKAQGEEIAKIAFTPQGMEFCCRHDFPKESDIKDIPGEEQERQGFFCRKTDGGRVRIETDRTDICILGDCDAEVVCSREDKLYHILVLDRARVKVIMQGYSVASIYCGASAEAEAITTDNSRFTMHNAQFSEFPENSVSEDNGERRTI